jgi:hypothetical protein
VLQSGGLPQLLDLLESKQINLQHNAAFALYGLSDNEDNIPCIIQAGGLQRLYDCSERLQVQASKVSRLCLCALPAHAQHCCRPLTHLQLM